MSHPPSISLTPMSHPPSISLTPISPPHIPLPPPYHPPPRQPLPRSPLYHPPPPRPPPPPPPQCKWRTQLVRTERRLQSITEWSPTAGGVNVSLSPPPPQPPPPPQHTHTPNPPPPPSPRGSVRYGGGFRNSTHCILPTLARSRPLSPASPLCQAYRVSACSRCQHSSACFHRRLVTILLLLSPAFPCFPLESFSFIYFQSSSNVKYLVSRPVSCLRRAWLGIDLRVRSALSSKPRLPYLQPTSFSSDRHVTLCGLV